MPTPNATKKAQLTKGYNFLVFVEDTKIAFSKISSIERSVEFESFTEGGMNGRVYSLSKPFTQEKTMVFERGVLLKEDAKKSFAAGQRIKKEVAIYIVNEQNKNQKAYFLSGCVVKKSTIGEFDASRSDVMIEKLEIVYENITITDY